MHSSRSVARGVWRTAEAAAGRGASAASTSAQVVATPRRVVVPFSTSSSRSSSFFSTSSWLGQSEEAKKAEEKKQTENQVAGEAIGATDKPNASSKSSESAAASETEELQKTIKEKDARIKELSDAVLYGKADMQNLQRRSQEEKAQASDYAITKFARELTSSLDVLALALRSVPETLRTKPTNVTEADDPRKAVAELYSGVELTSKSILDMLRMHGVTTFDPTGQKFDPREHEAMYQAPVPGKEPGTVLECSKLGFKIKDRVLRAAQVGVVQEAS